MDFRSARLSYIYARRSYRTSGSRVSYQWGSLVLIVMLRCQHSRRQLFLCRSRLFRALAAPFLDGYHTAPRVHERVKVRKRTTFAIRRQLQCNMLYSKLLEVDLGYSSKACCPLSFSMCMLFVKSLEAYRYRAFSSISTLPPAGWPLFEAYILPMCLCTLISQSIGACSPPYSKGRGHTRINLPREYMLRVCGNN